MTKKSQESQGSLVLAIDDNKDYCNLIRRVLALKGHKLISAQDGKKGIEVFKEQKPDLVLLDYELPDMTGAECLGHIKTHNTSTLARIVIFSGHDVQLVQDHFGDIKPDDFVQKPIDLVELSELLEKNIEMSQTSSLGSH